MNKQQNERDAFAAARVMPGQRVTTAAGDVVTVAMVRADGTVMAWRAGHAYPCAVRERGDAYGGEHDMALGA